MANWRTSREYRLWRTTVIRRDGRCIACGSLQNREAHHIDHATFFKDKRFDTTNGVTLCKVCHIQYHTNFHTSFREKCTRERFENFIVLISHYKKK